MAVNFQYQARDRKGKTIKGIIEGSNKGDVVRRLKDEGYFVTSIEEQKSGGLDLQNLPIFSSLFNRVGLKDLAYFCRQFSIMMNAGISLINSLNLLMDQMQNPRLKEILQDVLNSLEMGESFSNSLKPYRSVFSSFFIELVAVGEMGGVLDTIMDRLATLYQREMFIRNKVKAAVSYPAVLISVAVVVVIFLLAFVVPMFVNLFAGLGGTLPLPTRILLGAQTAVLRFWWLIIGTVIGIIFGAKALFNQPQVKFAFHRFILKVPKVGDMMKKVDISRFSRTVATLNSSGIPLLRSLEITERIVNNTFIATNIKEARENLEQGVNISATFNKSKLFPPMVTQMISIGEETGAIDEVMTTVADFYEDEVEKAVEAVISIIEPVMIVIIAAIVGFVILAIYFPMFQMITVF